MAKRVTYNCLLNNNAEKAQYTNQDLLIGVHLFELRESKCSIMWLVGVILIQEK